jgi:predicted TIM-barrel fold metal-dependent hydrolase
MGFLDDVKAAANDLVDSVDSQLSSSAAGRDAERHYRDLGLLTYLEETGRPVDPKDRERVLEALKKYEKQGVLRAFVLHTAPGPPTPPPTPPTAPPAG